ncbi:phosphate transport system permease protein [Desulfofustis limnaeus]|uniref:Phosphate transport system permease protein n=1 Tax=Desulfofustis limnaeus TaxID=2740163 RepID=A0ABM7W661_9BACT|nr:phosphate ABC transporter permease subunit PstC [Desulfofustis limnaeus]MDX9894919.1 phosphate ABC transporter permease subunit PstC [Desulfofustis sp.]BDD86401.1 phosphate transport system permease protein [Desulfofustis limnaeus]
MTILYSYLLPILLIVAGTAYAAGRYRARRLVAAADGTVRLHSLPSHYGVLASLAGLLPALFCYGLWLSVETTVIDSRLIKELPPTQVADSGHQSLLLNDIKNLLAGTTTISKDNTINEAADRYQEIRSTFRSLVTTAVVLLSIGLSLFCLQAIKPSLRARNLVEGTIRLLLLLCSGIAILITLGILFSVLFESIRFFRAVPILDFLFGLDWSPQMAIRADQAGSSGAFGAVPIFAGTFMIAAIAMLVAIPIGLLAAIYLSEFASTQVRTVVKPLLEILAGIPTVVYGFFAALTVAPFIRDTGTLFGLSIASESALAAGLVMGIMIIPFVSSLSDDVIHAVPQSLRDGSYGLGATTFETIRHVIFPAALPGIVSGILLAVSRAIGETMIVVMAAGLAANLTANPFEAVTTVTVQIVTLLVGDQEFDSPKTLAAFALGLVLFVFTLILNYIALGIVRKYREHYE